MTDDLTITPYLICCRAGRYFLSCSARWTTLVSLQLRYSLLGVLGPRNDMSHQTAARVGINSEGNTIHRKTNINITLDGSDERVYGTHDTISGLVTVEHENDAVITELTLTLEGATATRVSNASNTGPTAGRAKGRHHFLKLQHPIDASLLSARVVEDGRTQIQIPFTFVVPEKILPGACSHKTTQQDVEAAHLLLPPTLEDDHYANEVQLARISYAIRVWSSLQIISTGAFQNESRSFGIRIVPNREEEPPLGVYDDQHEYCLRRTVPIRSTFRKVLGELVAETSQPPCAHLTHQTTQEDTVNAAVRFTFTPAKPEELPPEITAIGSKLLEYTFYAASPFEELPRPKKSYKKMMLHRCYVEDFTLSTRELGNVSWSKHVGNLSTMPGEAHLETTPSFPRPGSTYYKTSISLPVVIPQAHNSNGLKRFPPSFHSCLVSRTHALEFEIRVKSNTSVILTTPIQFVFRNVHPPPTSPLLSAAVLADIDRVFSYEGGEGAPQYEEEPSQSSPEQSHGVSRPSQADELPNYANQTQRTAANRQSVSTTYEVPPQEWQNLWTGAKWAYGKAKAFHQRISIKS